jgi:hypothetical protein
LAKEQAAQAEQDRLAKEQAAQAEKDRLAKEQAAEAERDRLAKEQAEQAEQDRLAKEQAAQAEKDRLAKEQAAEAERDRLAREQAERQRIANQEAARERLAQQQADADKANGAANASAAAPAKADPGATGDAAATGDKAPPDKTAMLTPPTESSPPQPADALSGAPLVVAIKKELQRVGCYSGSIDDDWTSATTKSSLGKFTKYAKLSAAPTEPAIDFLDLLRGKSGRVCPLACSPREVERDGECVAKACPSGTAVNDDGSCTKRPKKTAALPAEMPSGGTAKEVATAPYDPNDRSRRITPGGLTTCGPAGCEKVPVGCVAVRGMRGGHKLGGKIICPNAPVASQTSAEPSVTASPPAAAPQSGCSGMPDPAHRGPRPQSHHLAGGGCGY